MESRWLDSQPWIGGLAQDEAGIWAIKEKKCAIGIVLLAQRRSEIVLVQKAPVKGYEYSNALTLPGGVVRGASTSCSFLESLEQSALFRVRRECGLQAHQMSDFCLDNAGSAPVTSYYAKGMQRHTLVLAARCKVDESFTPRADDATVVRAFLASPPFPWKEFAPANRLVIARAFADVARSDAENASIVEALSFCNGNAEKLGLPLVDKIGGG